MQTIPLINYKELRKSNPQTARQAVIQYFQSVNNNISDTARVFGIYRPGVVDIIIKYRPGDFNVRSLIPHHHPIYIHSHIESYVVVIIIVPVPVLIVCPDILIG